jgi:hypothetical protein
MDIGIIGDESSFALFLIPFFHQEFPPRLIEDITD